MGQWPWGQGPDCLRDLLLGSGEPTVSLSPASGGDTAVSVLGGSWQREELRVLWESWKTACLLKDGSSYVWTWEICLEVQSTWWFTALKKSCCAYLTHLWVVDYLLSFLRKWSLACREHQGRSRSYSSLMWVNVTRAYMMYCCPFSAHFNTWQNKHCFQKGNPLQQWEHTVSLSYYLDKPHLTSTKKPIGHNAGSQNFLPLRISVL